MSQSDLHTESEEQQDSLYESLNESKQRVFFALWPDETIRTALTSLSRQYAQGNGRTVAAENLHLTLVFVGAVTAAQRAGMEKAAATVVAPPIRVCLNSLGFWPRPRVLWVGADTPPSAMTELVTQLNAALMPCGYRPDMRPFKAHVTLARKARHPPDMEHIPPLVWQANEFCLVTSVLGEQGSDYRVVGRWPLRG